MSRLARAAARLRQLGFRPAHGAIGGAAYVEIRGFSYAHLIAAAIMGAWLAIGIVAWVMLASGRWVGNRADGKIVEAITAAGVDLGKLSTTDIATRLTYAPQIAQALVEARNGGHNDSMIALLAGWLSAIPPERRGYAMQALSNLASTVGADEAKLELAQALSNIDAVTARALRDGVELSALLRKLAAIPSQDRRSLVMADFPVRPVDAARAQIWATINHPGFPAADLVGPLGDLAKVHPDRLIEIRHYVAAGPPLPRCRPVQCAPVACSAVAATLQCQPGWRLTAKFSCMPELIPPR